MNTNKGIVINAGGMADVDNEVLVSVSTELPLFTLTAWLLTISKYM